MKLKLLIIKKFKWIYVDTINGIDLYKRNTHVYPVKEADTPCGYTPNHTLDEALKYISYSLKKSIKLFFTHGIKRYLKISLLVCLGWKTRKYCWLIGGTPSTGLYKKEKKSSTTIFTVQEAWIKQFKKSNS